MTNSEIILCSDIKLDRNYENVLSYNEEQMVSLCRSKAIYTGTEYKIVGVRENKINVSARYEDCIYANYMAFINRKYGNKWFFAWVTDVKLLNPATTEITFQIDVFSTWYSSFNVGQAFIEREHVSDDTLGANLVPENLETGEYIAQNLSPATNYNQLCVVVASMTDLEEYITSDYVTKQLYCGIYDGIPAGCGYYKFTGLAKIYETLEHMATDGLTDNIVCMFLAPNSLITVESGNTYKVATSTTVHHDSTLGISRVSSIGNYTPVNKKVLTYPYVWINITNGVGQSAVLQQEFWELDNNNEMGIDIVSVICPGMSIKVIPINYKGKGAAFDDGISWGKLPIISYPNDIYTNWMTQNGVNLGFTTLNANEWANVKGVGSAIGGMIQASMGSPIEGIHTGISGMQTIFDEMQQEYRRSFTPYQLEGSLNTGDVATAGGFNRLFFSRMTITESFARRIDKYFSRFGYRVNDVKTPNLNSRLHFNFIKVGGQDELVHGNIPASALEEINGVFRKGVTIFHDYDSIGNYTINNPIVQ